MASVLAVGLSFVFGVTVTYVTSYQPLIRLERRRRSILVTIVLNRLLSVYRDEIANSRLRVNVMTVNRRESLSSISGSRELAIDYASGEYTEWEQELTFGPGEGAAETAFEEDEIVVYDSWTKNYIEGDMTVKQLVATEHVTSVVSVSIYRSRGRRGEPIGVLNLDSAEHVGDTKFNTESARTILMKYASAIGDVLE